MTTQAGELLNAILSELCHNYDFPAAVAAYNFNFTGTIGPYAMPATYLRLAKDTFRFTIDGVPYFPKPYTYAEYLSFVQQAGNTSYPVRFATDPSATPINLYVWPQPSGAYPASLEYYQLMPDITTPESSSDVPWFPNQTYLLRRLTGELMMLAGDQRANGFLGGNEELYPQGADVILRRYLRMMGDEENTVKRVDLDKRFFGSNFNKLKNTKTIGW